MTGSTRFPPFGLGTHIDLVPESRVEGIRWKECLNVLQAADLELLRPFLNHLPVQQNGYGNKIGVIC